MEKIITKLKTEVFYHSMSQIILLTEGCPLNIKTEISYLFLAFINVLDCVMSTILVFLQLLFLQLQKMNFPDHIAVLYNVRIS